ncbi:UNVERIFIED_CONTAM: hypothetical protein Sindi_3058700 [Sesamum indicum]
MDRSPRFGSISSDNCPMKTRFRYGLRWVPLTKPLPMSTRSEALLLPLLESLRFHVLFHSPMGFFSPFPHGTTSLSVTQEYFSLARWSLLIHTGFHVSHATRVRA